MKMKRILIIAGLMLLFAACGSKMEKAESGKKGKIKVVATTTMLTDLVRTIGGEKVEAEGLMGEGVDPHLYSASAGDIKKLSEADLIVYGGLHLEGKMGEVFESLSAQKKEVLNVGDGLDRGNIIFQDDSTPDPHVWFDVNLWTQEAEIVAARLSELNPENREYYTANLENYRKELEDLKKYVETRINEIPEKSRVLVTAHDAFGYFGREFKIEVKAIQGVSTDSETGVKNISDLADFIVERNIKAVFVESSVPKKSIEALQEAVKSRGKEVKIGGELYSDSLGDKEHNTETYIKTVRANTDIIVEALK